jgi:3-dehydroquinate synthase
MSDTEIAAVPPEHVRVDLGARSYDIFVGSGLIDRAGEYLRSVLSQPRAVIVSDGNVAPLYLGRLEAALGAADIATSAIVIEAGEQTKSFAHLQNLIDDILDLRIERSTSLIALGGGVVGDLVGFAAAILLRGIAYIQIPTTLLAQVDSSVGGKTAIDTRHGKNLIGAFHQPRLVLADLDALATLPEREWLAGYAEVAKYGLIGDAPFFEWLERNAESMMKGDAEATAHAVALCCAAKARVVGADERESGQRALLNFGHTFGHAFEAETGFGGTLLHGEGISLGMVRAFELSAALGHCDPAAGDRARGHLARMGLPVALRDIAGVDWNTDRLMAHMATDKKTRNGRQTFILARAIGDTFIADGIDPAAVRGVLDRAISG